MILIKYTPKDQGNSSLQKSSHYFMNKRWHKKTSYNTNFGQTYYFALTNPKG